MATPDALLKNEFAANFASRLNSNALPVRRLVPDGVTIRTEVAPPAVSAPETDVVIENSATLSDVGRFGRKSNELVRMKLSWMLMPSSVTVVQVGAAAVDARVRAVGDAWHTSLQLDQVGHVPVGQRDLEHLLLQDRRR